MTRYDYVNFFFLFSTRAEGRVAPSPTWYISPFRISPTEYDSSSFGLKVKCMYSYYEITRCVKRIALPSPKQHDASWVPLRSCSFPFFLRATHVGTARIQRQDNGSFSLDDSQLASTFALSRARLNRDNRLSLCSFSAVNSQYFFFVIRTYVLPPESLILY